MNCVLLYSSSDLALSMPSNLLLYASYILYCIEVSSEAILASISFIFE